MMIQKMDCAEVGLWASVCDVSLNALYMYIHLIIVAQMALFAKYEKYAIKGAAEFYVK